MPRAVAALGPALLCACAGTGTLPPGDDLTAYGARAERIVIGVHADVSVVAASRTLVFAATSDALLVHDLLRASWLPPLGRADGYPGGPVSIAASDPLEDGVWLAGFGTVLYHSPTTDLNTSTTVPGVADALFFDRRDPAAGAYVRSGGAWLLVSRTGASVPVAARQLPPESARQYPSTLRDVYRAYPALQSFATLLTRDARQRSWPVTSGARAPDRDEVYLGTRGNGLFQVDPLFQSARHLPFGLLEQGVSSLASAGDGVWIGGSGTSPAGRGGVTYASHDLQRWIWFEGPAGRPLGRVRVNAVSAHGSAIWLGTDRGVFRLDANDRDAMQQWTMSHGLPGDEVLSLMPGMSGTWIGTSRGLAFIAADQEGRSSGEARSIGTTTPTRALLGAGDRLWLGSDAGLLTLDTRDPAATPVRSASIEADLRLRRPIRALAASDTVLLAATDDELFAIDLRSGVRIEGEWLPGGGLVRRRIRAVAADAETVWLGANDGVSVIMRASGAVRDLRVGRDLPGEVTSLVIAPGVAWIGTSRGVMRVARHSGGGIR